MELDFLGAEQNLSVLAGSQAEYDVRFIGDDGEPMDLTDVTFDGVVTFPDGSTEAIDITQDENDTARLHVVFPLISDVNSYAWEMRAVGDSGDKMRVACGKLGVLPTSLELEPDEIEDTEVKQLDVHLPGKVKAHAIMVWRATTRAALSAERARLSEIAAKESADAAKESADAAEKVKEGVKQAIEDAVRESTGDAQKFAEQAKKAAEDAAERAANVKASAKQIAEESTEALRDELNDLMADTEETRQSANATVQKLEGFLAKFADNVRSVVWVNPENDHLIIGGVDTECKVTGEPGKSPWVDENGDWQYWDDDSQQWKNGGPARGEDGFAPYVNAEGYLVFRDPLTGEVRTGTDKMYGRDGLDGTQVRRIIIQSKEDLPQDGETCNGGFYYYIPVQDAPPIAIFAPKETRTGSGTILINGQSVSLPASNLSAAAAAASFVGTLQSAFPEATVELDGADNAVILIADVPYWQVQGLSEDDWTLTVHVRMERDGYDVYAWCEEKDGSSGWVRVGEANDLATAEIYGLTKLATNATIEGGAPVGNDETGAMRVPRAEIAQQGTVKLSIAGRMEETGGGIGVDSDGKIWVQRASRTEFGTAKTSYNGSGTTAPVVGINDTGQLVIPFAGLNQAGVVKLGSYGGQTNPRPYNVAVGADVDEHLVNNLVYGGALQHMNPAGWIARNMPWLDEVHAAHPEYFVDLFYLGIVTSEQFTQSAERGIELNSASASLLAGVFLAADFTDTRGNAVPSVKLVGDWVHQECYTKTEIDQKEQEFDTRITDEVKALNKRMDSEVQTLNRAIKTQAETLNTRIDTEVKTLNSTITDKEKALSDRIQANTNKFAEYTTTKGMQTYIDDRLKPYATTQAMETALAQYYKKAEMDNMFVRGEENLKQIGVYTDDDDIVSLSKANPDKLYIKSQRKK